MPDSLLIGFEIDTKRIRDILRYGIDALVSHGFYLVDFIKPESDKLHRPWSDVSDAERRLLLHYNLQPDVVPELDYPVSEGGAIVITAMDGRMINGATRWRLDLERIQDGLRRMATVFPQQYRKWEDNQQDDKYTGILFVQFCLWGKTVYSDWND